MIECYVNDIAIKSHDKNNHLHDLRTLFDIIRAHRLKMNPTKSFLGVWVASSWDSLLHQREFILTQINSKSFIACIHLRISKNLGACKVDWLISEDSSQIS